MRKRLSEVYVRMWGLSLHATKLSEKCGINEPLLNQIMTGRVIANAKEMRAISKALNCSDPGELFPYWDDEDEESIGNTKENK